MNIHAPFTDKTNIVDLDSVLFLFFTSKKLVYSSFRDLCQFKIVKEKSKILFRLFERNRIWFSNQNQKVYLSVICSISGTDGEIKMYNLTSPVTWSGGRNINKDHFISYESIEDELIL